MFRPVPGLSTVAAACLLASTAVATGPTTAPPAVSDVASFHWTSALAAPRAAHLNASNGGITVTPSTDGKLDVRAVVGDGDASKVKVVAREDAAGVVICVLLADESPEVCQSSGVNHSGSGRNHQNEPNVALVARVPPGVSLTAQTLNGAVHAHPDGGDVRATTLNGDVDVSGGTVTEATTLNGNIEASFTNPPAARARFSTNNGNVKLRLPSGTNADVEASTIRGEITATFPIAIESTPGGFGPKSGKGKIGNGGSHLEARSINGNVELRVGR